MGGDDSLIMVGRIVRPHGIRGDVKVVPLTDWPERFKTFRLLYLEKSDETSDWIKVEQAKVQQNHIILKLSGIDSRNKAEVLKDVGLYVREQDLPSLPEGHYYIHDLVGMHVRTVNGKDVGSIVNVIQTSAQDIYVVDTGGKEILIPAVKMFVKHIDSKKREVLIDPIEGLIDANED